MNKYNAAWNWKEFLIFSLVWLIGLLVTFEHLIP